MISPPGESYDGLTASHYIHIIQAFEQSLSKFRSIYVDLRTQAKRRPISNLGILVLR